MTHKSDFFKGFSRIVGDGISAFFALHFSYFLRPISDLIPFLQYNFPLENLPPLEFFLPFSFFATLGFLSILASADLYSFPLRFLSINIAVKILWSALLWVLSIIAVYALFLHELFFSRLFLAHTFLFTVFFSLSFRLFFKKIFQKIFPHKISALVIADRQNQEAFRQHFRNISTTCWTFVIPENFEYYVKNSTEELEKVEEIFFFEGEKRSEQLRQLRHFCAEKNIVLHSIPQYAFEFSGHAEFNFSYGFPLITTTPYRPDLWWSFWKRLFDILFSLLFCVLFFPFFVFIAVAIVLEDGGNPFYVSFRVGRGGKIFSMIKFRSMVNNAEKLKKKLEKQSHRDGPLFKIKNDPRVTRVGRFLRKTSLDEIPQFFNVLKGEMSVIGPRPHLPEEVEKYEPHQKRALSVKPGISGLAQISGRSDLGFEEEIFLDSYYAENSGFLLDTKIFFKTPFVLLGGKGAD